MDNILGRLSMFDFFNLLATGAVFLIGLELLQIHVFKFFSSTISNISIIINREIDIIHIIIFSIFLLIVCYLIGSLIQELSSLLQKKIFKIQDKYMKSFLNDPEIIKNEIRRQIFRNEAEKLFENKNIPFDKNNFTEDHCHYFYAYCVYSIQVRELHKKAEKMRALHGISNMFSTCFAILAIIGILSNFYLFYKNVSITDFLTIEVLILIYSILAVIFWFRMKKDILYRIRMVAGIYEASIDKERDIANKQTFSSSFNIRINKNQETSNTSIPYEDIIIS